MRLAVLCWKAAEILCILLGKNVYPHRISHDYGEKVHINIALINFVFIPACAAQ